MKKGTIKNVSVVFPCYKDEMALASLIPEIQRKLSEVFADLQIEFVVMNDNPDRLVTIVPILNQKITTFTTNQNLGSNVQIKKYLESISLIDKKDNEITLIMDADGEDGAEGAILLLKKISENQQLDCVIARRLSRDSSYSIKILTAFFRVCTLIFFFTYYNHGNFAAIRSSKINLLRNSLKNIDYYPVALMYFSDKIDYLRIAREKRIMGTKSNYLFGFKNAFAIWNSLKFKFYLR